MKIKMKILTLILAIIFSLTIFPLNGLYSAVKATYVEGEITMDTVWTLVDSPFVLFGNVTVLEGITLTIEPGVEVRFGGNFSLIVRGRLIARGILTQELDRRIRFTSNRESPQTGDWGALYFNGAGQSSVLENCIIEYGRGGVMVERGNLTVQNAIVRFNSEHGVNVLNSSVCWVTISHTHIYSNNASGVYISGGNVTVEYSTIESNREGITLTGNLTVSSINITQNSVNNNDYGIRLSMDEYNRNNFFIGNNDIYSNNYGVYVSTNVGTIITRNYIYNNSIVGIFYKEGIHEAHFNDIYNNACGMDVGNATVIATYNYWGHQSGPYHESLNPRGKGNRVGGNGVNLRFIFFLSASIKHENRPPKAVLWTDKNVVVPGQNVTFVGTNSYDNETHGRVDYYLFDFRDGQNSGWTTLSLFFYAYTLAGTYNASLRVIDDFNSTSDEAWTIVQVRDDLTPLTVSLSLSDHTVDYNASVSATIYVSNGSQPVDSASVNLFAFSRGFFANLTGSTNSTGYSVITFAAPNVKDVTDIRVIARASKDGYADGSDYKYLRVLPPLHVKVEANNTRLFSEETTMIMVNVTDAYGWPVANVTLRLWMNDQLIDEGLTDTNGTALFEFTAPLVYNYSAVNIQVEALKEMYAKGFGACVIEVFPKVLTVKLYSEAQEIRSEESTSIVVYVSWEGNPVPETNVTLSAEYGTFDPEFRMTDSNGTVTFTFIAPRTTVNITVTIIAIATKEKYVSGANWTDIRVRPKVLVVSLTANRDVLVTEEKVNASVHVECDGAPVSNANVTLALNISTFTLPPALTDAHGDVNFTFDMVAIPHDMIIAMTVTAQKDGYVDGYNVLLLTAKPANLTVSVYVSPSIVKPGEFATLYVHVMHGTKPVANASVTVSATINGLTPEPFITDASGYCVVPIYVPASAEASDVYVTVEVSKEGYNSVYMPGCAYFQVVSEAGFPWFTLLLVLVPVLLVVVFVVLVKLGVISVSFGEEEETGSVS
jgi:hypothetical protein